jgi:D-threo-aldose 1-dehydrogenase
MPKAALPGTHLAPSRLGFGCASLMGRLGRRDSIRLLEAAHESGITHFDTARSYGYGEAESALGEFLSRRRDAVTITTKLGIAPPRSSRRLAAAKGLARFVVRKAPGLRRRLRRQAGSMVAAGRFEPADARASLETSLRELGTDHVDILLLHECSPADLETEGLVDFLEAAVAGGHVRHWGIATDLNSTRAILGDLPERPSIVQLANNPLVRATERLPSGGDGALITHSAVAPVLPSLLKLVRDERPRERWSSELGLDCGQPTVLAELLLGYALNANARGIVLFSSTDAGRIRSNAALGESLPFSSEQIDRFAALAREALSSGLSES